MGLSSWVISELMEQKKPKRANWVFIADFTANIGKHKCFVVLGVSLAKLKSCQWHLTHQDVTLLGLELWEHSNGEKILKYLEKISSFVKYSDPNRGRWW